MPKTYVDNAMNRSLGRVGMAHGSMPVSRSSGGGGGSYGGSSFSSYGGSSRSSYGGGGVSNYGGGSSYSTKTYVDNSYNRSLGRVGMPHGSMSVSKSDNSSHGSSSGGTKTYVDNSYNRSLGRVGLEHGSVVVSKSASSSGRSRSGENTYVDNSYNRSLGRVGMQHGTVVVSKSARSSDRHDSFNDSGIGTSFYSPHASPAVKVYKDNPLNRRLNRVGLPHGAAVHSKSKSLPKRPQAAPKTYVDNAYNRAVGRVGKPLGSMPISRRSKITSNASEIYKQLIRNPDHDLNFSRMEIDEEQQYEACDIALSLVNRMEEVLKWQHDTQTTREPQTSERVLQNFRGTRINFDEIELMQKIGSGGFGDVHLQNGKEPL